MMMLGLHERTDVIRSSAQLVFPRTDFEHDSPLPTATSLAQIYDDAGQGLLLLGAPGAGKTTLLLDLARELLTRAESDPIQPLPVILNLSSWASKKLPLTTWLVDQLRLVYGLPSSLGQALLDQDQWIVLLDGLDEVEASARGRCIEAINTYRGEHFAPLVVCSRSYEYLTQEARLALSSAVEIQPLQEREVMEYLKRIGKPMAAVRAALRTNPVLKQLLATPLMLSMVILAYRDKAIKNLPTLGSVEEQQRQVFARYVERMLEQRATMRSFTPQQTCQWLTWLAQNMKQQHLTEFYLERLQPTWLSTKRLQMLHAWVSRLGIDLIFGLIFGLGVGLAHGLVSGLIAGLVAGLFLALGDGLNTKLEHSEIQVIEALSWSRKNLQRGPLIDLIFGLAFWLVAGVGVGLAHGLVGALVGALIGTMVFGLIRGLSATQIDEHTCIHPNQGIRTSGWNALRFGLMGWLGTGLGLGLASGPVDGLNVGLGFGLLFGGRAYLSHYILRYLLWRGGVMPWRYVRFLEEASECILLQRVGGGFRFIHPLFQEYFAVQGIGASPRSQLQPSPQQS